MNAVNGAENNTAAAPALREGAAEVIQLLKDILREAESGQIVGVAVCLALGPGTTAIANAGTKSLLLEMLSGTEDLHDYFKAAKAQLMAAAMQRQQQQSRLVRPPPGFDPTKLRG